MYSDEKECIICMNEAIDPVLCDGCGKNFCKKCALFWKIFHDVCPLKCSKPWKIKIEMENNNYEGFIHCPNCKRIGSLLCPKSTCRKIIDFEPAPHPSSETLNCQNCDQGLKLYQSIPHESCETWSNTFFYKCEKCLQKYCDCVIIKY